MRSKILKCIVEIVFILIANLICSIAVTAINIILFHGTIDKRVLLFIHFTLGGIIGIIVSKDAWKY